MIKIYKKENKIKKINEFFLLKNIRIVEKK